MHRDRPRPTAVKIALRDYPLSTAWLTLCFVIALALMLP